ncbi:flagellar motor switch protein FliN [Nesterenkonia lutea]|uniref:Flagellar motor switch protein FliN/FliY n=1 Tax=Nesterenkonia lutea TaxID=272919 RepID=A0ABR9JGM6_9MICC|nr:flagellar motor switch protein FliN [Nesterenkonia lutea]MBE1524622.1 flagellar motor switch protein FliN/FliY [Nesterenkonia lutea]
MSPIQDIDAGSTASRETTGLHVSAAEALCAALPVSVPVTARRFDESAAQPSPAALAGDGDLSVAAFVGSLSAEVAVRVDPSVLGDAADLDPKLVSIDDVLRPAFEAATGVLGTGVLSTAPRGSAEGLLQDPETVVFELLAAGDSVGWFAVRLREPVPSSASAGRDRTPAPGTATAGSTGGAPRDDENVSSRLSRLNNVQMALTVEIGRTRVSVRDVLAMEPGAVIELDRNAGAPADVRLNGRLIAQGEVVVMDQDYGVRITKILDSSEGLV